MSGQAVRSGDGAGWGGLSAMLYRALLAAYPGPFRREVAADLVVGFRERVRQQRRAGGRPAAWRAALGELADLLRNLPREWRRPSGLGGLSPERGPSARARRVMVDLVAAARSVWRQPGFALCVVAVIGIGIGATASVYSVVDAVLLEPLPFHDADRLVYLNESYRTTQTKSVSYPNYLDWRARNRTFEDMAARAWWSFNLTNLGDARELSALIVSPDLLPLLGVEPALGRGLAEGELDAVLVSHAFWQGALGGRTEAVGETLTLDGEPFVVVGVLPAEIEFPLSGADVVAPIDTLGETTMAARGSHPGMVVIGRLRDGVTSTAAQADLDGIAAQLAAEYPESNAEAGIRMAALADPLVRDHRQMLWLLMAAVVLVLLGVCFNLANLLLVRATRRTGELAIRSALGAGRARIARQLLLEAMLLVGAGGAVGLGVAADAIGWLRAAQPGDVPRVGRVDLDLSVVVFTVLVSAAIGLALGAVPLLGALRQDPARALGGGSRGAAARSLTGLRGLLVAAEVALAMVLLVGAGLMVRTTLNIAGADPGLRTDSVVTAYVGPPQTAYPEVADRVTLYRQIMEGVSGLPGVVSVAGVDPLPLSGYDRQWSIGPEGFPQVDENGLRTDVANVTPEYFDTMGIPLLAGRGFTGQETADAPVVIVDETLAAFLWPGESAVGRRLKFRGDDSPWMTVIGVAGHVKPYGVTSGSRVQLYMPYTIGVWGLWVVAQVDGDAAGLVPGIRSVVSRLDPQLPLTRVATMRELFAATVAPERLVTRMLAAFASAALLLSLLGLYAVVSYSVATRTRELGIRIALGAGRGRVLAEVSRRGLVLTAAGIVLGVLVAAGAGRLVANLLFEVGSFDLPTVVAAALATFVLAAAATIGPALRATRVDPREALRST